MKKFNVKDGWFIPSNDFGKSSPSEKTAKYLEWKTNENFQTFSSFLWELSSWIKGWIRADLMEETANFAQTIMHRGLENTHDPTQMEVAHCDFWTKLK